MGGSLGTCGYYRYYYHPSIIVTTIRGCHLAEMKDCFKTCVNLQQKSSLRHCKLAVHRNRYCHSSRHLHHLNNGYIRMTIIAVAVVIINILTALFEDLIRIH